MGTGELLLLITHISHLKITTNYNCSKNMSAFVVGWKYFKFQVLIKNCWRAEWTESVQACRHPDSCTLLFVVSHNLWHLLTQSFNCVEKCPQLLSVHETPKLKKRKIEPNLEYRAFEFLIRGLLFLEMRINREAIKWKWMAFRGVQIGIPLFRRHCCCRRQSRFFMEMKKDERTNIRMDMDDE